MLEFAHTCACLLVRQVHDEAQELHGAGCDICRQKASSAVVRSGDDMFRVHGFWFTVEKIIVFIVDSHCVLNQLKCIVMRTESMFGNTLF